MNRHAHACTSILKCPDVFPALCATPVCLLTFLEFRMVLFHIRELCLGTIPARVRHFSQIKPLLLRLLHHLLLCIQAGASNTVTIVSLSHSRTRLLFSRKFLPTRFAINSNGQVTEKWLCFRSSSISSRLRPLLLALPMTRRRQKAQLFALLACPALPVWEASVMPRPGRKEDQRWGFGKAG